MTDDLYTSLHSKRLYKQVVERIEGLILSGQLKPGDRLPAERELSENFGVSRTVIRESVRSLQEKGLVEIRPGVGTFIYNGMTEIVRQSLGRMLVLEQKSGLKNLIQVREILEPEIAAIAAEHATENDIEMLQSALNEMEVSMKEVEAFITADHEFHLALARATQNQLIVNLIDSVVESLSEQRRQIFLANVDGPKRGQEHHYRIFYAVRDHNQSLARRYMIAHLLQIREDSTIYRESD